MTMNRRDLVKTLISVGLGSSLTPMALGDHAVSPEAAPPDEQSEHDPLDIALVPLQLALSETLPEESYVENDDYFGFMTEVLFLGVRRITDVKAIIANHFDYAIALDRQVVELLLRPEHRRPQWATEGILARAEQRGVFLSHVGLARTALIKQYPHQYRRCDTRALARKVSREDTCVE